MEKMGTRGIRGSWSLTQGMATREIREIAAVMNREIRRIVSMIKRMAMRIGRMKRIDSSALHGAVHLRSANTSQPT